MLKLRLIKGASYKSRALNVCATVQSPVVDVKDQKTADKLVETGYFAIVPNPVDEKTTTPKQAAKKTAPSNKGTADTVDKAETETTTPSYK